MTHPISSPKPIHWVHVVHAYGQLFRLSFAGIAAAAGCAAVYALNPALPLSNYLLTGFILTSMTAAACAINDYWDIHKDRINHPERPLPSDRLSLPQAWWAAALLFASALIAAIPLGGYAFLLVAISTVLLWYYSLLLNYSGILGNFLVATIVAFLLLLSSLAADRPFALLYPIGFLFCYALAREVLWDVHDAEGDRVQGVVTLANVWGSQAAFSMIWGLIGVMLVSIPIATTLLPMGHPLWFAGCAAIMLLTLITALIPYQRQINEANYQQLVFWERLGMLFGVVGLLGTAPSL
ncbi:UbiA family prenyltransferase [Egbenema bharatensis]|uniref:UbiA family prenyltransferase n=1 Tax=Egbenema bharatensis TaxID=3463334 RepID=UPI003A8671C5